MLSCSVKKLLAQTMMLVTWCPISDPVLVYLTGTLLTGCSRRVSSECFAVVTVRSHVHSSCMMTTPQCAVLLYNQPLGCLQTSTLTAYRLHGHLRDLEQPAEDDLLLLL